MVGKILNLITRIDVNIKQKFVFFIFVLIFSSILEAIGIGLVIPLISTIIDTNNNFINNLPLNLSNYLKSLNKINLIIILSCFVCLFFTLKNIFLIIITYYQSKFYYEIKNKIVKKIYRSYIYQEYFDFIKVSSSKRINNILTETQNVLEGAFMPLMTLISELFVLIAVCSLLMIYNFKITIIALSLLIFLTLTSLFLIKPLFTKWGKKRLKYYETKVELLNQTIYGIREIKLFQMGGNIINLFNKNSNNLSEVSYKHIFFQLITKFYLEIGAVISFVFVVIFFLTTNSNTTDLITLLSLYGLSIFRVMPSINKVINAKNSLRFSQVSVERILQDFKFLERLQISNNKINVLPKNTNVFENWKKIEFHNLKYSYDGINEIFQNINFKISNGDKIGIIGKSGSGKSTFVDLLCNLIKSDGGEIKIDKKILSEENRSQYLKLFSYASQNTFIFNTSLKENITLNFVKENDEVNLKNFELAIKTAQLNEFIKTLDLKENQIIGEEGNRLSGGQKQRIGIARSLYAGRKILILDEATSSLDTFTEENFINSLLSSYKDKTIIFITHKKNVIKNFDAIYEIDDKKIIRI